jgi:hypothetical protein
MSKPDEIKRLLERLHELSPDAQNASPNARPPRIPSQQQRTYFEDEAGYENERLALPPPPPERRSTSFSPWLFVLATALNTTVAAVLAVLITLGVVQQDPNRDNDRSRTASGRSDDFRQTQPTPPVTTSSNIAPPTQVRAIRLAAIGSPQEPLRLEAGKASRLPLRIEPDEARRDTFILVLSGLPAASTLTGASKLSSDSWLLAGDAVSQLEITVPEWSTSLLEIDVELRRTNGVMAARTKAWVFVPPPASPEKAKLDETAVKDLTQRAEQLLARGDVVAARMLYERAADMGSGQAAMSLGATYDPRRLWSLGVFGMVGSKDRARQWYQRADQLGHPEAKERIRALGD